MIQIEERGLRPFEQDVLTGGERVVNEIDRVGDVRLETRQTDVEVLVGDLVGVQRELVEDLGQDLVLLLEHDIELLAEDLRVEQVLDANADSRRLVGVRGSDASLRGAELAACRAGVR